MTDERNPELNAAVRAKLRSELTTAAAKNVQDFRAIIHRNCPDQHASQLIQNLAETVLNGARDRLLVALGKDADQENVA
jgi:hypothetical protein